MNMARRVWLALALALLAMSVRVPAHADDLLPTVAPGSVAIAGDWRNGVLYGSAGTYWAGHDTVSWYQRDNSVSIAATRAGQTYPVSMTFQAPAGQPLQVGHYVVKREYDAPPPPVIQVSGGSTCGKQYGEFDVLDLAPDRLWVSFHASCGYTNVSPSVYGEVRFGEPLSGDVLTVPTHMPWGPEPLEETNDPVPITLVNLGATPLAVTAARTTGTNAGDFLVGSAAACASVPAGGSCNVDVTFEPTALGARSATLAVTDSHGGRTIALSGSGVPAPERSDIPRPTNGYYPTCPFGLSVDGPDAITFEWGHECNPTSPKAGATDYTAHYLIRGAEGTTPPVLEEDGFHVYSGHGHRGTVHGFNPAKTYSFTLFTQYFDGSETTRSLAVYPTKISAAAALLAHTRGAALAVTGRATLANGTPVTDLPLELRALYPGTSTPVVVARGETDSNGDYDLRTVPNRAASYTVTYTAVGHGAFPATSAARSVPLSVVVGLRVPSSTIKYGKTTTITGSMAPPQPSAAAFQVLVKGNWKTLAWAIPNAKGVLSFRVALKNRGTFYYRVWWAGSDTTWEFGSPSAKIRVK